MQTYVCTHGKHILAPPSVGAGDADASQFARNLRIGSRSHLGSPRGHGLPGGERAHEADDHPRGSSMAEGAPRRRRPLAPGLDLNAVLMVFGLRFVFRFGGEVQESRQNKTKNETTTKRKTPFRSSPVLQPERGIRNRPTRRCPMEVSYPGQSLGPTGRLLKGIW